MQMTLKQEGNALIISVSGRLDSKTAPELDKTVEENVGGIASLTFDLQDLVYTSSAGLRIFLKAQKLMNRQGQMKLIHVCDDIMEIFEMTGFNEILTIE